MDPLHILVLDRSPGRQQGVAGALRAAGNHVVVVSEPEQASEALGGPGFDSVLVDLAAPELDTAALRRAICPDRPAPPDSLEAAERRHILVTLQHTGGNRRQAAQLLGISRSTLLNKIRRYDLE